MAAGADARKPPAIQAPEQARRSDCGWKEQPRRAAGDAECDLEAGRTAESRRKYVRYMVVLERGETSWGAHVPDLPGCLAVGESREEVLRLIREAIELHIDGLKQDGLPVPPPCSEVEIVEVGAV